ncbi:MAG TPA: glutathione peroxidase [Fastidiosipila sp.]|jgi:glutathione peroxidase|nr:glutathione peroxidase [Fastidiosipila sp.]
MSIYDFTVNSIRGKEVNLADYKDHVVLIVNTASKCGYTPQFEGLENLYQKYKDRNFVVLGFPSNQFGGQDPGTNDEIGTFCKVNYGVTFPMMAKVDVNGQYESSLFTFLKKEKGGILGDRIKWNFTKFLIDKNGEVVKRYAPTTKPEALEDDIEALL